MLYLFTLLTNILLLVGTLLSIAAIIITHELGHYLAARVNKLYAASVSIGFGKLLAQHKDSYGTSWELRAWPLGGYVDLVGNDNTKSQQWHNLYYVQKSSIILAGVCSNLILAWLLLGSTAYIGFEQRSNIIAKVYTQTPAAKMQLLPGDKIVAIDNIPVTNIEQTMLTLAITHSQKPILKITIDRQGQPHTLQTDNNWQLIQEKSSITRNFGINFQRDYTPATVTKVNDFSAAEQAGLRRYDKIISINNQPVYHAYDVTDYLRDHPKEPLILRVQRQQHTLTIKLPQAHKAIRTIHFMPPKKSTSEYFFYQESLAKASLSSCTLIYQHLYLQTRIIYEIITGQLSIHILSGPVEILQLSLMLSHSMIFILWLRWLAAINISLAFINMLPIPILDGGQWFILTITALTGLKPSQTLLECINYVSIFIIAFTLSVVTYFEIINLIVR